MAQWLHSGALAAALAALCACGCAAVPPPQAAQRRTLEELAAAARPADTPLEARLASHLTDAVAPPRPEPAPRFQRAGDRIAHEGGIPEPRYPVAEAIKSLVSKLQEPYMGAPPADEGPSKPPPSLPQLLSLASREPSNDRDWIPEHRVLARAEFDGDRVTIRNVRHAEFFTYRDCIVRHEDRTYDLTKLRSVDFIVVPFKDLKAVAHTMLSFGFDDGQHVGISVEVRLENGEAYDPALGLFGQFELIYVVADERDLIPVRVEHRDVDVYVYPSTAPPEMARKLFVDMLRRLNQLYEQPEFYDTLANNCTTNIVRHINAIAPGKVPYDYHVLLPGYADRLAYDLGLIDNRLPFEEIKRRARVNDAVLKYRDHPEFSARIRRGWAAR
jgi:hypothetical protein